MADSPRSTEKFPADTVLVDEEVDAIEGYVIDASLYPEHAARLKTTNDGKTVLIPQPSDDPDDPLNWQRRKKYWILAVVTYTAFLADYTSGAGIVVVIPQVHEWNLAQYTLQHAVVGNLFSLGASGLFAVAFANYFGRLPTLLVFQSIALATCAWAAAATNFESYETARILNGLFESCTQGAGILWIKDMFFFHEHPRLINILEFPVILSPYLGPLLSSFILYKTKWQWAFWLATCMWALGWILILFTDETLYDRSTDFRVPRGPLWKRILGIEQAKGLRNRSFVQAAVRPIIALTKIPVLLVVIYYFLNFAWVIGVNTTVSIWLTDFYDFNPKNLGMSMSDTLSTSKLISAGFFYFFGPTGVFVGWFVGHWIHDAYANFYARRHNGRIEPEARLALTYLATFIMAVALLILGFAIQHRWHYMVLAVCAAIQCVGIMIATTAVSAYLLDAFPEGAGEINAWVSIGRAWGGFMATYVQIPWVEKIGSAKAMGIQTAITGAAALIIVFLQIYGKRIRIAQGRMVFGKSK
ncbi:MAG: hypothetical protein M1820_002699 [Bogoriella megaspora]|nr:MAG: hypothetical protein M1820_002699 [Bogoriella megaspora]